LRQSASHDAAVGLLKEGAYQRDIGDAAGKQRQGQRHLSAFAEDIGGQPHGPNIRRFYA